MREEQHHTYMWREQAIIELSWHMNSIVACCHSAKLCAYAARNFRSQHNQHRAICPGAWQVLDSTWRGVVRVLQWFQQDGATPHTSNESLAWVQQRFPDRPISRGCDPQWSPHSPDMNPPDFYMWGYLKERVYGNNPRTIPDLKAAITAAVSAIPKEECGRVIENLAHRIQMCLQRQGTHLEHIFLSASETKSFCSTDLKLWRCLLHRLDLM